jgi:hypothetical protein
MRSTAPSGVKTPKKTMPSTMGLTTLFRSSPIFSHIRFSGRKI